MDDTMSEDAQADDAGIGAPRPARPRVPAFTAKGGEGDDSDAARKMAGHHSADETV